MRRLLLISLHARCGRRPPDPAGAQAKKQRVVNLQLDRLYRSRGAPGFTEGDRHRGQNDTFDSNDTLETKLLAENPGSTVVVPTPISFSGRSRPAFPETRQGEAADLVNAWTRSRNSSPSTIRQPIRQLHVGHDGNRLQPGQGEADSGPKPQSTAGTSYSSRKALQDSRCGIHMLDSPDASAWIFRGMEFRTSEALREMRLSTPLDPAVD